MYVVNAIGVLRVSEEGEIYGLDLHEHGISAYPEYVISTMARPGGMGDAPQHPAPKIVPQPIMDKATS